MQKDRAVIKETSVVHIIDDDESLRLALDSLFRSVGLGTRCYASASEFLAADWPDVEGCLVLDIRLHGISGLDFQEQLAERGVRIPVILMTGYGDIPMSVRGMKAGAVDFLTKPFREQEMLDAVTVAIERDRKQRLTEESASDVEARFKLLSNREQQVMAMVTTGLLNKQVAGKLGISEITVKIHRGSAMRKMAARTLPDLVRMADLLRLRERHDLLNTTV